MRNFHEGLAEFGFNNSQETQEQKRPPLAEILTLIARHKDPKFKPADVVGTVSIKALANMQSATISMLAMLLEPEDEERINLIESNELLEINSSLATACTRSKSGDAEMFKQLLDGYDIGLIAILHNISTDQVFQQVYGNKEGLLEIINTPSNVRAFKPRKPLLASIGIFEEISPKDFSRPFEQSMNDI